MTDAPMMVRVKPLVWREAPSVLRGMEYVSECRTYYLRRNRGSYQVERNGNPVSGAISQAEAIIFADNDNAARILAAIEAVPVAEVWRRAIEAAAQAADDLRKSLGTSEPARWVSDIEALHAVRRRIRALPMPDDLGVRHD